MQPVVSPVPVSQLLLLPAAEIPTGGKDGGLHGASEDAHASRPRAGVFERARLQVLLVLANGQELFMDSPCANVRESKRSALWESVLQRG